MPTLRLLAAGSGPNDQPGEVLACMYTPDGAFVLSGGFDGHMRLWETAYGAHVTAVRVGDKPVSACGVTPDGKHWLSGSLDGLLSFWDALTHRQESMFLAHPRPISAIVFGLDNRLLATAAWDGNVILWSFQRGRDRESRILSGHRDIVAGCRFTPDAQTLLSWGYDGTVRLWDVTRTKQLNEWTGHNDRVTAGAVSPDGRWAASGARNGVLRIIDLQTGTAGASIALAAEIRSCMFLLDGETLVAADARGRLTVHAVPSLQDRSELVTRLPVQCAALAPSGSQLALGCSDGKVRFVAVEGLDGASLAITATQSSKRTSTALQRLFGKSSLTQTFQCICPACRQTFELPQGVSGQSAPCPNCRRNLRISAIVRAAPDH